MQSLDLQPGKGLAIALVLLLASNDEQLSVFKAEILRSSGTNLQFRIVLTGVPNIQVTFCTVKMPAIKFVLQYESPVWLDHFSKT